ncbi:mitochondrial dicarboxylate transporter [Fusarium solani]|uniref:Mitochondrial dicarboxylate transporter n=1 Tax=Fusarium solani TaxID=169388 RepID=A0A9P9GYL8_FUSSL|nr:mitochondrial dicarboxylate transporter [Fusarium solani]KAH7247115.1 mitochondrial dicarboxylate transporter [Fusarium solani]
MASKQKQREPFWLGGAAACMAVCFTHPLDQTKYRMQVLKSKTSMLNVLYRFAARDGIPSLWTGLSASILRQGTYSTARFGFHTYFSDKLLNYTGAKKLSVTQNIACAGVAGGVAGLVGNPAEVILVRMCADGAKAPPQQFQYSNAIDALARVYRDEGMGAFWKGLTPNIARSVLMNVSQIATYSSAKQYLTGHLGFGDDTKTHAISSLMAGTMATTLCAPADVLKSRIQSSAGKEGLLQVLRSGLREEGALFLMRGWTPAWLRLTPHTVLTFVFMEKLRYLTSFGNNWLGAGIRSAERETLR